MTSMDQCFDAHKSRERAEDAVINVYVESCSKIL
jgi:hypothetical protein